jgi:hypothetical protein
MYQPMTIAFPCSDAGPDDVSAAAAALFAGDDDSGCWQPEELPETRPSVASDGSSTLVCDTAAHATHALAQKDPRLPAGAGAARMHLALRAAEVAACAENMWAWARDVAPPAAALAERAQIPQLARGQFDRLLQHFAL